MVTFQSSAVIGMSVRRPSCPVGSCLRLCLTLKIPPQQERASAIHRFTRPEKRHSFPHPFYPSCLLIVLRSTTLGGGIGRRSQGESLVEGPFQPAPCRLPHGGRMPHCPAARPVLSAE